jgi:hypothetical protein
MHGGLRGALAALLALVLGGAPAAAAAPEPPDVRGLTIDAARERLMAWSPTVSLEIVPDPADLPRGVSPSVVVVIKATWLNSSISPGATVVRPRVRVDLGVRLPDLTGLTLAEAADLLAVRGLSTHPSPDPPPDGWRVSEQSVPPGTLVDFALPIGVTLAPVSYPFPWLPVGVAAGAVGLLAIAALVLLLRARRRRGRTPEPAPVESVHVQAYRGRIIGPELTELTEERR